MIFDTRYLYDPSISFDDDRLVGKHGNATSCEGGCNMFVAIFGVVITKYGHGWYFVGQRLQYFCNHLRRNPTAAKGLHVHKVARKQ